MAQRRSTLARTTRNHGSKALVMRSSPHHRLSQTGDAMDRHSLRIHLLVRLKIILDPAHPPCPSRNRTPVLRPASTLPRLQIELPNAVLKTLSIVRFHI